MKEQTTLKLFLSNGTLITVYYNGDIFESLSDELENAIKTFLICNWDYEQMVISDGCGKNLFSTKDEPSVIDCRNIIGWDIVLPE